MWKEHVPSVDQDLIILPFGLLHVHSVVDNEFWLLDKPAQTLLPPCLRRMNFPQTKVYDWLWFMNNRTTNYPIQLREIG